MKTKTCSRCKQPKALDQFSTDKKTKDGKQSWCKACFAKYRQTEHCKAANRQYKRSTHGRLVRKRHLDKPQVKRLANKSTLLYGRRNPDKRKAYAKIAWAVTIGTLSPIDQCLCSECGEQAAGYHHENYDKPLDVIPLCRLCHSKRHR